MNLTDKLPKPSYDDQHPGVRLNASPQKPKEEIKGTISKLSD